MVASFVQDVAPQRLVFAAGAIAQVPQEVARLGFARTLVVATPGSGARLGQRLAGLLDERAAALHAQAVVHVPKAVAEAGVAAARDAHADGVVAAGGGAATGLAKIIARDLGLPILALPTTYSGSEATPIWGMTDGEKKFTGKDARVVPRTVVYDPELTLALPPAVSAASGMNALAHSVGGLLVPDRTPVTEALAADAARRFATALPRVVADGNDVEARGECLVAAWLAGTVLNAGTWLTHKLAHVLGGLGLPHAETHAIILPHTARFCLAAAPGARARLAQAFGANDPAGRLAEMLGGFPIPQRLSEVGFDRGKIEFVAGEMAGMGKRCRGRFPAPMCAPCSRRRISGRLCWRLPAFMGILCVVRSLARGAKNDRASSTLRICGQRHRTAERRCAKSRAARRLHGFARMDR